MFHAKRKELSFPLSEAIVFDGDGVCYNTDPLFFETYRRLMKNYEVVFSKEEYLTLVGCDALTGVKKCGQRFNIAQDVQTLKDQWKEIRDEIFATHEIVPRDGVLSFVQALSDDCATMALVTTSDYESTTVKLAKAGYRNRFKHVICSNGQMRKKPHPDLYLHAAQQLKLNPNQIFVVEDSDVGIEAAFAAGCYCVAFPHEYTAQHKFSNAHYIASSITDLREHFIRKTIGDSKRFC